MGQTIESFNVELRTVQSVGFDLSELIVRQRAQLGTTGAGKPKWAYRVFALPGFALAEGETEYTGILRHLTKVTGANVVAVRNPKREAGASFICEDRGTWTGTALAASFKATEEYFLKKNAAAALAAAGNAPVDEPRKDAPHEATAKQRAAAQKRKERDAQKRAAASAGAASVDTTASNGAPAPSVV